MYSPEDGRTAAVRLSDDPPTTSEIGILVPHLEFLGLLAKILRGRAGGEDGVLTEFMLALFPVQIGRLLPLLTDARLGRAPMPSGWREANVTLIPKCAGALEPTLYRSTTYSLAHHAEHCPSSMACSSGTVAETL